MPLGMTMNNSFLSAGVIILENKLPLRPATKWRPTWSGGFELEQLQVLIGGMGGVGRAEKKGKNKNERRCTPLWYQNGLGWESSPDTAGSTGIVVCIFGIDKQAFFFFWLLQSSLISSHAVGQITREHRATGNAN